MMFIHSKELTFMSISPIAEYLLLIEKFEMRTAGYGKSYR